MIYYRTDTCDMRSYALCFTAVDIFNSFVVVLPISPVTPEAAKADYNVMCFDTIATSEINRYGERECHHLKVEGTILGEANLWGSVETCGYSLFGYSASPALSSTEIYTWISSQGGTMINIVETLPSRASWVLGVDFLPETSLKLLRRPIRTNDYYIISNQYYKTEQLASNKYFFVASYAFCKYNKNDEPISGYISCVCYVFEPKIDSKTRWSYKMYTVEAANSRDLDTAYNYLDSPQVYYAHFVEKARRKALNRPVVNPADRTYGTVGALCQGVVGGADPNVLSSISTMMRESVPLVLNQRVEATDFRSDLCVDAIQRCQQIDVNSLAYAKDLISLKDEVKNLATLAKGWKNPTTLLKTFLSSKYGLALTYSDTLTVAEAVLSDSKNLVRNASKLLSVRSYGSYTNHTNYSSCSAITNLVHYKVMYEPLDSGFLNGIKSMMDWDVWPTLQNSWDLIPLSFVADWLVDVEGLCERTDATIYSSYLDVKCVTESVKSSFTTTFERVGVKGRDNCSNAAMLTVTAYDRTTSNRLALPSFKLDFGPGLATHLPETSAIIALSQKTK